MDYMVFARNQKRAILAMYIIVSEKEMERVLDPIDPAKWARAWAYVGAPEPPPQPKLFDSSWLPEVDLRSPDSVITMPGREPVVRY